MKRALVIPFAVALAIFAAYLCYSFIFLPVGTLNCAQGDKNCIKDMESKKLNCIPSSTIIHGRDGIVLMVNITREGDKCVRTEEVIGSGNTENDYLIGHNVTCEYGLSQLDNASATACPGSLYEYVAPSAGGNGQGMSQTTEAGITKTSCLLDDAACKDTAISYLQNCVTSEIVNTDLRWNPSGYWTTLTKIERMSDTCRIYFEVLNAVNLPPGVPTTIIGSSMVCNIPLSEFPPENLTATWCTGELYNYLYP